MHDHASTSYSRKRDGKIFNDKIWSRKYMIIVKILGLQLWVAKQGQTDQWNLKYYFPEFTRSLKLESGKMLVFDNPIVRYDTIIGRDWLQE